MVYCTIQWIQVRRVRWPLILADESGAVGGDPVLCHTCSVCRSTVLLENEASWQKSLAVCKQFRWQSINVKFGVHLGLFWYEVQSSFTTEADASRNHDVWRNWLFESEGDSHSPHASSRQSARLFWLLPARRYASAGYRDRNVSVRPSVRLSVRPSRAGIVSKRRKLASWFLHHLVAPRL